MMRHEIPPPPPPPPAAAADSGAQQQQQPPMQPPRPPLHQFQVTKLRSWRTGYVRLLVLYEHEFATLDPTSTEQTHDNHHAALKETNRWPYAALQEWMAVPKEPDTILLQVSATQHSKSDTLKFMVHGGVPPVTVLTRLLQQRDCSGQANTTQQPLYPAQRWTRHGSRVPVLLQVKPFGIAELHAATKQLLQTYFYHDIRAVSFPTTQQQQLPSDDPQTQQNGIFLHFRRPHGKVRLYTVAAAAAAKGGGGRTAFLQSLSAHYVALGLNAIPMEPSCTTRQWLEQRRGNLSVGPTALQWTVTKTSRRHDSNIVGTTTSATTPSLHGPPTPGGVVSRQLAVTGNGFLVERDAVGVVRAHPLRDLWAIVRPSAPPNAIQLEFLSGGGGGGPVQRSYTVSHHRDAVIVSLLDAAQQLGRNRVVHVTDTPSAGYLLVGNCSSSSEDDASSSSDPQQQQSQSKVKAAASALFQPPPVPLYTLKRVYTLALHAFALASGELGSEQLSEQHQRELDAYVESLHARPECWALQEACRAFNANVQRPVEELLGAAGGSSTVEKHIIGTMGALFGLIGKLLLSSRPSGTHHTTTVGDSGPQQPHPLPGPQNSRTRHAREQIAGTFFQTLQRLAGTPTGYKCSAELTTLLRDCLPTVWSIEDTFCKFGAYSVLNGLLSGTNKDDPAHAKRDMEAEYVNKNVLLQSGGPAMVNGLVSSLLPGGDGDHYSQQQSRQPQQRQQQQSMVSDLILMVTSDILQSLLCSYHDTTSPEHFQAFIAALAHRYRALLSTLRSSTPFVIENTALLLHLLSTHAPQSAAAIRDAALSSAILLQHFYNATFSPLEGQRFLSRYLCSLWFSGPMNCDEKRLLKRMVPHGFLAYLNMPALSRMEEEQLDQLERDAVEGNITDQGAAAEAAALQAAQSSPVSTLLQQQQEAAAAAGGTNTVRLRSRIAIATATAKNIGGHQPQQKQQPQQNVVKNENFRIFFHVLTQNHSLADLIWSQQTRRELRIALESELDHFRRETDARGVDAIAWNHQQFRVDYPSLDKEVKVGNVYMRLWLQAGDGFIRSWDEPVRLFEHLFRRFLCEVDRDPKVTVMCIRCLERLYAIHASSIGPFTDVMILVRSMTSTPSVETQHRLLGLLATVLGVSGDAKDERYEVADIPENAEQLLNIDSISQLCQFVAWGHTNGDQVGNMLSRVVSVGMNGKALLTDGTDFGPGGSSTTPQSSSTTVAADSSCPSVWFVAATGRIPPPPELIKGPFRVSDLMKMMETGDVTPYDLVTTSHVEEYDMEGDGEAVQEAQIDTGKWKRLNQVWQLRWQLCTDQSSTVIYSPSDVALLALKALTRLVDLHRSLDSRGVPYVPIPTAKRILCGSSRDPNFASDTGDSVTNPLPIVCQALLCNDGRIVEHAADLIFKLCQHNEQAVSKLYLTGIYFFIFCYTGSNFRSLAKLLHATHLKQHFKSGFAAAADESELPMKDRSILGHMLPEGLLFILTNYGVDRFAEVFVSNADTPEVIWTFDMRKHLIEMIRQHLGDFPLRLFQNTTTEYEYCPMPGVAYKRLEKEIFCHNYYLHNLCDEVRFPEWPISEPVEVFRACLEQFKKQLERDETSEEEILEKARAVLDLKVGDGSKELRKAYRSLARRYHPDKNPAGRETFEAIQTSYEVLLPLVERGEKIRVFAEGLEEGKEREGGDAAFPASKVQMETLHLLIKAQLLICRRYERDMAKHKYPAYSILLSCIRGVPEVEEGKSVLDAPFAKADRAMFVRAAVELIFRTCLISPLNSEGLVLESGVSTLASLLRFYITFAREMRATPMDADDRASAKIASDEVIADIIAHSVRTLSGVAFYESGRAAIVALQNVSQFLVYWRRCLDGSLFVNKNSGQVLDGPMKRFAMEGVANMAQERKLSDGLIGAGVLWPLLKSSLLFDPTLEQAPVDNSDTDDIGVSVSAINIASRLSVRALGVLGGFYGDASCDTPVAESLKKLLTVPIARMLRNKRTGVILRILNSNVERADIIWNVRMRNQLETLLDMIVKERPEDTCRTVDEELAAVGDFQYDALRKEVQIGGIYVRCFNKGGKEELSNVVNAHKFFDSITTFIANSLNSFEHAEGWINISLEEQTDPGEAKTQIPCSMSPTSPDFLLAMNALRILCRVEGLIDDALCSSPTIVPSLLLSLLELSMDSEAFEIGSDILYLLGPKQVFADAVTRENSFWRLLQLVERPEPNEAAAEEDRQSDNSQPVLNQRKDKAWSILEALSSSPSIADAILSSAGWIELLGVLVGYAKFTKLWTARVGAAKTLSRLLWDPKTGSVADSLLKRFLPTTLTVRLKADPEAMLRSFDSNADTPELIWDASMRSELRNVLGQQLEAIIQARKADDGSYTEFVLGPEAFVKYSNLDQELYIGGVYVSRFLKEPTYNLRDPTAFLELLLQRWTKELESYTSPEDGTGKSTDTAITTAGQDVLELVTTASVYLCKVRDSLCDKLAAWGYMARSIDFLDKVLEMSLTGTPLLSIIRLLHVASDRMANVEALALVGHSDGRAGAVDFTLKAIGGDSLHPDTAFMIEFLKKTYRMALGDLKRARPPPQGFHAEVPQQPSFITAAPSPAPGDGPVRKQRVNIGDDPLGMMQPTAQQTTSQPSPQPVGGFAARSQQIHASQPPPQQPPPPQQYQALQPNPLQQSSATSSSYAARSQQAHGTRPQTLYMPQGQQLQYAQQPQPQQPHFSQQQQPQYGQHQQPQYSQQHYAQPQYTQQPPQQSAAGSFASRSAALSQGQQPQYGQPQNLQPQQYGQPQQKQSLPQSSSLPTEQKQSFLSRKAAAVSTVLKQQYGQMGQKQEQPQSEQAALGQQYRQQYNQQFGQQQQRQQFSNPTGPYEPQNSQQSGPSLQSFPPRQQQQNYTQGYSLMDGGLQQNQQQHPVHPNAGQGQVYGDTNQFAAQGQRSGQGSLNIPNQNHSQYAQSGQRPNVGHPQQQPNLQQPQQGMVNQQQGQQQPPFPQQQTGVGQGAPTMGANQNMQFGAPNQGNVGFNPGGAQQGTPNLMNQQQPQGPNTSMGFNPSMPSTNTGGPIVETVHDEDEQPPMPGAPPQVVPQYGPTPTEGAGIDARTAPDPRVNAERQASTFHGAPGAAQGRVALLQQALACQLCEFLVEKVLEHPDLLKVRDPASVKVHAIELLKMLTKDPGFGAKFKITLDGLPAWKKYKSQDHSLLITGHEQKADYFLTDGASGKDTKLLTES